MNAFLFFDLLIIGVLVMAALLVLVPLIYGLVKKKYWVLITEAVVILCVVLCLYLFPTRFPYADPWIMGKTKEQIVAVYGQPTGYNGDGMISYILGKDGGVWGTGLMGSNNDIHYYIYFDENGEAYKIQEGCQLGG